MLKLMMYNYSLHLVDLPLNFEREKHIIVFYSMIFVDNNVIFSQ